MKVWQKAAISCTYIVSCKRPWLKNRGWALTQRRCLNSPTVPMQVPTPDPKLIVMTGTTELTRIVASAVLPFLGKRGQHGSRESCILLQNRPPEVSLSSLHSIRCLQYANFVLQVKNHCRQGYDWCVQTLLPDVVACLKLIEHSTWTQTVNFRVTIQEFCVVGGYTEDLTNHRTVKIGGWALARGWELARDNTIPVSISIWYSLP